jgi:hypothetical protein
MSTAKPKKEMPKVKVEITTGPATIPAGRVWDLFWQQLLKEKAVSGTSKDERESHGANWISGSNH